MKLTPSAILLYHCQHFSLDCPLEQKILPGCQYCILNIPYATSSLYFVLDWLIGTIKQNLWHYYRNVLSTPNFLIYGQIPLLPILLHFLFLNFNYLIIYSIQILVNDAMSFKSYKNGPSYHERKEFFSIIVHMHICCLLYSFNWIELYHLNSCYN